MQDKKAAKALRTEMKEADTNGDGMISFIEFLGYFQKMARYRADLARTQRLESYGRPRDLPPSMCFTCSHVVMSCDCVNWKLSDKAPSCIHVGLQHSDFASVIVWLEAVGSHRCTDNQMLGLACKCETAAVLDDFCHWHQPAKALQVLPHWPIPWQRMCLKDPSSLQLSCVLSQL